MKILKMIARFGKLNGSSLELGEGMNIIAAPNESGKSTWCAFIRAMLYGVDTKQRQKSGSVSEKSAANPWSGLSPQGSMDIEYEGALLTLRRETANSAAPMRQFSAVYTGTEDAFPLTGTGCGETLTGADKDVFTRSAFMAQGSAKIENSPSLEKQMSAMLSTGDDCSSVTDADERLRAWQRERCHNARVGMNARLEEELIRTEDSLREAQSLACRRETLIADIAAMENLPREDDFAAVSEALSAAEEHERACRAKLDLSPFGARDSREVSLQLQRDKRRCLELLEKSKERYSYKKLIAPALLLIVTLVLAVLGYADRNAAAWPAGLFLALCLISAGNGAIVTTRARDAAAKRRKILRDNSIDDESGFDAMEEAHRALSDDWIRARDEMLALRRKADIRRRARESDPLAPKRQELYKIEGRLSAMESIPALLLEKQRLHACMEENLRQCRSIELARALLQEANRAHLSDFSPKLTSLTAKLFSAATGGKYTLLSMDSALGISARPEEESLPHGSEYMSEGTQQLLYLCLRLAVSLLSLPEEKNVPLILDDALCTLDDERCRRFLDLLYELSKNKQIILFTCHSREANYLRGREGVYTPEV